MHQQQQTNNTGRANAYKADGCLGHERSTPATTLVRNNDHRCREMALVCVCVCALHTLRTANNQLPFDQYEKNCFPLRRVRVVWFASLQAPLPASLSLASKRHIIAPLPSVPRPRRKNTEQVRKEYKRPTTRDRGEDAQGAKRRSMSGKTRANTNSHNGVLP